MIQENYIWICIYKFFIDTSAKSFFSYRQSILRGIAEISCKERYDTLCLNSLNTSNIFDLRKYM